MVKAGFTQLLLVLFVALGSLSYGYSVGIIATTLGQPSFIKYFGFDWRSNTPQLEGAISGLFQAGAFIGALSCQAAADALGRRKAILIGAIISVVGGALQAGSVDVGMFIAMRLISGLALGGLVTLVPLYQTEVAPPKIRGLLVGMHGVFICCGYALSSWMGVAFYYVNAGGAQWRPPLAIQCLPPILLAIGVMYLPESPRWLLNRDRIEEAYAAFKRTCGQEVTDVDNDIRAQFNFMHSQLLYEKQHAVSFKGLLTNPHYRKRCLLGWVMLFAAQGTGTQVINNYGPMIYGSLGFGTSQQLLFGAGWITMAPLGNILTSLVVDRIGRVKMFIIGFSGVLVGLIGVCISISIFQRTADTRAASAAVVFFWVHGLCFCTTIDATSYIYIGEIFPTPCRARGMSICMTGIFTATIIFLTTAPTGFAHIKWKYYLIFVCITAAMIPCFWFFYPETAKMSLEEISTLFGDPVEGLTEKQVEIAAPIDGGKKNTRVEDVVIEEHENVAE